VLLREMPMVTQRILGISWYFEVDANVLIGVIGSWN
jgi:hypothetical protein